MGVACGCAVDQAAQEPAKKDTAEPKPEPSPGAAATPATKSAPADGAKPKEAAAPTAEKGPEKGDVAQEIRASVAKRAAGAEQAPSEADDGKGMKQQIQANVAKRAAATEQAPNDAECEDLKQQIQANVIWKASKPRPTYHPSVDFSPPREGSTHSNAAELVRNVFEKVKMKPPDITLTAREVNLLKLSAEHYKEAGRAGSVTCQEYTALLVRRARYYIPLHEPVDFHKLRPIGQSHRGCDGVGQASGGEGC